MNKEKFPVGTGRKKWGEKFKARGIFRDIPAKEGMV